MARQLTIPEARKRKFQLTLRPWIEYSSSEEDEEEDFSHLFENRDQRPKRVRPGLAVEPRTSIQANEHQSGESHFSYTVI